MWQVAAYDQGTAFSAREGADDLVDGCNEIRAVGNIVVVVAEAAGQSPTCREAGGFTRFESLYRADVQAGVCGQSFL